jgi:hypothetical protein
MVRALRLVAVLLAAGFLLVPGPVPRAAAQDADTPLDKALQKLEAELQKLKAQPNADQKLIDGLEEVAANLRKEKESRSGKAPGGGGGGTSLTGNAAVDANAMKWARDTFFLGTELKDDEKAVADQILVEFCVDYKLCKDSGDEKSKPVVHEHSERKIARSFGTRDANKLKSNLDSLIKQWEWAGGRRGR